MEKQLQRLLKLKFQEINHASKSGLDQNSEQQLVQMLKLNGLQQQRVKVNLESLLFTSSRLVVLCDWIKTHKLFDREFISFLHEDPSTLIQR